MPTKTAMQQLIDYMEHACESDTNFPSMVLDFHKKALELREVEREQIEKSYDSARTGDLCIDDATGEDYFNETYK